MLRYRASVILFAAFGLLLARPARAQAPSVAVLGVEPLDVPEALAQQLTDALRQRAASTAGLKMIQGKDLIEIKMVFNCDGETPECLAKAGKSLGADKLLYGTLKKARNPTSVVVGLKLLDVRSAIVEKFINETVNKRDLAAGSVNASAARWFAQLVEVESRPSLTVTSEPPNAAVAIDGQPAGRTPVTLRELSPGSHTVAVSMGGHLTQTRSVDLRPGGSHEVVVTLPPVEEQRPVANNNPPPPIAQPVVTPTNGNTGPQPSAGHPGRTAKIVALSALVGAVVAGGVAIYTWRSYSDLQDSAHNELNAIIPDNEKCPKNGAPADPVQTFACHPNGSPPASLGTGANVQQYKNDYNRGQTFANTTTALWVVAGALAAGSVVSYIVGDRQAAHAEKEKAAHPTAGRLLRQSLRVAPMFSTQGGSLSASFEF